MLTTTSVSNYQVRSRRRSSLGKGGAEPNVLDMLPAADDDASTNKSFITPDAVSNRPKLSAATLHRPEYSTMETPAGGRNRRGRRSSLGKDFRISALEDIRKKEEEEENSPSSFRAVSELSNQLTKRLPHASRTITRPANDDDGGAAAAAIGRRHRRRASLDDGGRKPTEDIANMTTSWRNRRRSSIGKSSSTSTDISSFRSLSPNPSKTKDTNNEGGEVEAAGFVSSDDEGLNEEEMALIYATARRASGMVAVEQTAFLDDEAEEDGTVPPSRHQEGAATTTKTNMKSKKKNKKKKGRRDDGRRRRHSLSTLERGPVYKNKEAEAVRIVNALAVQAQMVEDTMKKLQDSMSKQGESHNMDDDNTDTEEDFLSLFQWSTAKPDDPVKQQQERILYQLQNKAHSLRRYSTVYSRDLGLHGGFQFGAAHHHRSNSSSMRFDARAEEEGQQTDRELLHEDLLNFKDLINAAIQQESMVRDAVADEDLLDGMDDDSNSSSSSSSGSDDDEDYDFLLSGTQPRNSRRPSLRDSFRRNHSFINTENSGSYSEKKVERSNVLKFVDEARHAVPGQGPVPRFSKSRRASM